jgi:hypothetical protein
MQYCPFEPFELGLIHVAPPPPLTWLEAANDGVKGVVEVLGRMLSGRIVAAAHVTTSQTEPEVDPRASRAQTFLTTFGRVRLDRTNLIEMRTRYGAHRDLLPPRSALPNRDLTPHRIALNSRIRLGLIPTLYLATLVPHLRRAAPTPCR